MGKKRDKGEITIAVCHGRSCKDHDAKKLREKLERLAEAGAPGRPVSVVKCGCRGECGKGIVAEISPGKRLVRKLKPKDAESLLEKALSGDWKQE